MKFETHLSALLPLLLRIICRYQLQLTVVRIIYLALTGGFNIKSISTKDMMTHVEKRKNRPWRPHRYFRYFRYCRYRSYLRYRR